MSSDQIVQFWTHLKLHFETIILVFGTNHTNISQAMEPSVNPDPWKAIPAVRFIAAH